MKKTKIFGIAILILAIVVAGVGVAADLAKKGDGAFASRLAEARATVETVNANAKAVKNVAAMDKKIAAAETKLDEAAEAARQALDGANALDAAIASGASGDADVDALRAALEKLGDGSAAARAFEKTFNLDSAALSEALDGVDGGVADLTALADEKELALYQALVDDSFAAVSGAESAVDGARESAEKIWSLIGQSAELEAATVTGQPECADVDACRAALQSLLARAEEMDAYRAQMDQWRKEADAAAAEASKASVSAMDRMVIALADNFIGVLFTAALLLILALVMLFMSDAFRRQWTKNPVFSVGMALIVMLIFQTYALGFGQGSVGAWAKFWFDNTFNVLRANTSVGMIALGMTLVIITGGIDLAVGSTLAGVGTILMTLIDTGEHGVLVRLGITGTPAFAIGIVLALISGMVIGGLIGLLVTKGRVPPFIVTLGVMNVVRSVAQYFTKSYTPTVPKEFEAIANTMVLGQRPMTILYWLVLAVIFYLVMKNTAFGRHVYAVGSNERTTRLSGINTDRVKRWVYAINGLVVAVAAVSQLSRLGGMDVASAGSGYELDAIAAVVVGGTAMSGGRGSIIGTVLGVLIIGIMNNLLILLGVDSFLTDAFKGAIVVAAVLMQRKEAKRDKSVSRATNAVRVFHYNMGNTAQFGGASGSVFSVLCGMRIPRLPSGKPSEFASDEKAVRRSTASSVRRYLRFAGGKLWIFKKSSLK